MKLHAILIALAAAISSISAWGEEAQDVPSSPIESRTKQLLQADPQSILKMRKWIQDSSAARQAPLTGDFEPASPQEVLDIEDFFEISLEPDQPAPKIFLARYQSTAVSFVDAYGNPWPIRKISNYLKGLVLIDKAAGEMTEQTSEKKDKAKGSSGNDLNDPQAGSFTMTALKHGVVGNITVYLQGLATPVTILLVGKPAMYHRVATMRVSDVGPQTNVAEMFQGNGVSPVGSEQMVVEGAEGKAWVKGDYLYVQTPIAVFSPEILRSSPGNGKYRAYKLPKTTAVMGTGTDGRTVTLRILRHPAVSIEAQTSQPKGGL